MNKPKAVITIAVVIVIGVGMGIAESIPADLDDTGNHGAQPAATSDGLTVDAGGPYNGTVGEPVQFNSTITGGTAPYDYQWTFTGGASQEANPTHTYHRAGEYTVTLRVKDSATPPNIKTDTTTATITGGNNTNLSVDIGGPYNGTVGEPVQFNSTVTGGTAPYEYRWNLGDGTHTNETAPTHVYEREKRYLVRLQVKDSAQPTNVERAFMWININNGTLTVDIGGPYNGTVGEPVQFNSTVTGGIPPYEYHWHLGNGTHTNETAPTHTYDRAKRYIVWLKVTDSAQRTRVRFDFTWATIE